MALTGPGIDTSAVGGVTSNEIKQFNTGLDKDTFLQLLATEMQNQDPLEPTSNTEYVAQMAQFSSLEAMQNLSGTVTASQAMSLTGSYVIMNTTDAAGNQKQISGLVDYVTVAEGKAYLSINGKMYPYENFDSVVDPNYLKNMVNKDNNGSDTTGNDSTENKSDQNTDTENA